MDRGYGVDTYCECYLGPGRGLEVGGQLGLEVMDHCGRSGGQLAEGGLDRALDALETRVHILSELFKGPVHRQGVGMHEIRVMASFPARHRSF